MHNAFLLSCCNQFRVYSKKIAKIDEKYHRIDRILSERNVGSRNDIARLLRNGKVFVGGTIVRKASKQFNIHDVSIEINGVMSHSTPLLAMYYKPFGVQRLRT
jgi:16S rRNA U516 pseudouridylate synthase RsuA-like enzyme